MIGIVGEARYFALERDSGPEFYLPIQQMPNFASLDLVVRTRDEPRALIPALRERLRAVDRDLPTTEIRTMEQLVDRAVFSRRSVVSLLGGFAGFGLLLAVLGVYAVISYSVSQRRQEMGIRLALGATSRQLRHVIVAQAVRPTVLGLAIGAVASWLLARALRGLLFGVTATDPATFATVLAVLAASAAIAGHLPARRTARLDPVETLRSG